MVLSSLEVVTVTRVQILDEAACISHYAKTLEKAKHSTILFPAMVRLDSLSLVWQPLKENENSEFKPQYWFCVPSYLYGGIG